MAEGERAWFQREAEYPEPVAQILHEFGRLKISKDKGSTAGRLMLPDPSEALTRTERIGFAVLEEETSERYLRSRTDTRFEGRLWDAPAVEPDDPPPLECDLVPDLDDTGRNWRALGAPRLTGKIAVASFFVSGPGALAFREDELATLQADVKLGMTLLNSFAPLQDLRFAYVIEAAQVDAIEASPDTPTRIEVGGRLVLNVEPFERGWRDAFLARLGLPSGTAGLRQYSERLRNQGADWAFVNLFTKYRLPHHAYAMSFLKTSFGMKNNWGSSKISRVVAHETGHIFGAPDEYGNCVCGGSHGPFGVSNENCVNCPGSGRDCLMRNNAPVLCKASGYHLGFSGLPNLLV